MMRDFQSENPSIMFEGGLKKAIEESNNYLKEIYGAENLTIKDSKGMDRETVIVIPKDIHHLVNTLAEKYDVSRPPSLDIHYLVNTLAEKYDVSCPARPFSALNVFLIQKFSCIKKIRFLN